MGSLVDEEEEEQRRKLEQSIYDACRRSLEGSDFLVSAFVQALYSYRRSSVCTPFPTTLFMTGDDFKDKDFAAAATAVESFPPLQDIVSSWTVRDNDSSSASIRVLDDNTSIAESSAPVTVAGNTSTASSCCPSSSDHSCTDCNRQACTNSLTYLFTADKMTLRSLKLLDWILRFRHGIEVIRDPATELSSLFPQASSPWASFRKEFACEASVTPHYVMKIHENEEIVWRRGASNFEAVKAESGSFFAFHGTSAENLHSILRCGLLNMSNSQLQRNGCIFGEGVYLSTDPVVAYTFCKAGTGWQHSFCGARVRYLLVCEVAGRHALRSEATESDLGSSGQRDNPVVHRQSEMEATANSMPHTYILVKNSALVKIRFVLVYSEHSRLRRSLQTEVVAKTNVSEASGTQCIAAEGVLRKLGVLDYLSRIDWCKSAIVLYIALLIGVGLLKHNAGRYGRGSFVHQFWPVYH